MPSSEAYPRALATAKKTVELHYQSSEAHASLAFVLFFGMWDVATPEREYQRAIELNPNNAVAHHWYSSYLSTLRRFPEALAEIERAEALDPDSKSILADKRRNLFLEDAAVRIASAVCCVGCRHCHLLEPKSAIEVAAIVTLETKISLPTIDKVS